MRISIVGTGYVGLVAGACLSEVGNDVLCIDVNEEKIQQLKKGIISIYEPGLKAIVDSNLARKKLSFSSSIKQGVEHGEVIFIAVGTPPDEDGSADLQYVLKVAESIGKHINGYKVVVNKSTVPIGSADRVKQAITASMTESANTADFDVISNPEFLKEGSAVDDFMKPERIIVGSDSPRAIEIMHKLYAPFARNREKIISMDTRSAELTKYAANAMLATKISFMNEMANLAEILGADIESVRKGIGSDPRIGYHFIYPGCGYGGSCFPKDVKALIKIADDVGYDSKIVKSVEVVNEKQKTRLFTKIRDFYNNELQGKTFALWGLSFKPNTDDIREAPSRVLIDMLIAAGARIQAYDPAAMDNIRRAYQNFEQLSLCDSASEALENADALIIVTEWNAFRSPDYSEIKTRLKSPVIFDGRNLYNVEEMSASGFEYFSIGRSTIN